ncbi:hypothetical protein N7456_003618 [Penicillium angulare]|uniref:Uncharacterized protein n=1 Tax=Penicillium angulare TaxID=116970 RepID=A0A9W9FV47_9EURO|nr:hypothetical protein N7456_003618 [Penicillium angulare]
MSLAIKHSMPLGGIIIERPIQQSVSSFSNNTTLSAQPGQWQLAPGVYTAKQFIAQLAVIPESILVQLGPDNPSAKSTSRDILMDGLRSSLSQEGRESTLPLSDWKSAAPSEMTLQAKRIGDTLLQYALEYNYSVPGNVGLMVYSPCEGHKWVPPAGRLLRSSRGSPVLMMLYNEWLHQITCLRDSLLVFENFSEVQIDLTDPMFRGTRRMEEIRESFLFKIRAHQYTENDTLEVAKVLTAPDILAGGYGFQYRSGTVLPESLFSQKPTCLLRYLPVHILEISREEPVLFDFQNSDEEQSYGDLPQLGSLDIKPADILNGKITSTQISAVAHSVELSGELHGEKFSFDLGTAILGLRSSIASRGGTPYSGLLATLMSRIGEAQN